MSKKPTVLMILDGFGLNDKTEGNAVAQANTPNIDALMKEYPYVKGYASGLAVGLPDGQMGNSEVGHLNMGAGRIVYQELTRITKEINDGDFFQNKALLDGIANVKKNNSDLHLYGLLSDGGVHSHITHLYGLLELAKRQGVSNVYVHCTNFRKRIYRSTGSKNERDRRRKDRFYFRPLLCDGSRQSLGSCRESI